MTPPSYLAATLGSVVTHVTQSAPASAKSRACRLPGSTAATLAQGWPFGSSTQDQRTIGASCGHRRPGALQRRPGSVMRGRGWGAGRGSCKVTLDGLRRGQGHVVHAFVADVVEIHGRAVHERPANDQTPIVHGPLLGGACERPARPPFRVTFWHRHHAASHSRIRSAALTGDIG